MKIPQVQKKVKDLIYEKFEKEPEEYRPHLGCSILGDKCDRKIWLTFRWALKQNFSGRIKRLFRRGKEEEKYIVRDLRDAGIDLIDEMAGKQIRVDLGCHVSGSLDSIINSGIPEAPKSKHIGEFKTHNKDSFKDLVKKGVKESKFEHYIQMQLYMHGTKINRAFYIAVCKDNDEIYEERVYYDKEIAEQYLRRGHYLALLEEIPQKLSENPTWFECKMCNYYQFCHETNILDNINCRTCALVTPQQDSTWKCERFDQIIPESFQAKGCECHVIHPDLIPYERKVSKDPYIAIYVIDGKEVANGEPCANTYASYEILADPKACTYNENHSVNIARKNIPGAKIINENFFV